MIQVFDSATDRTAEIAQAAGACSFVAASDRLAVLALYAAVERIKPSAS